jgi:hypothetical protein
MSVIFVVACGVLYYLYRHRWRKGTAAGSGKAKEVTTEAIGGKN